MALRHPDVTFLWGHAGSDLEYGVKCALGLNNVLMDIGGNEATNGYTEMPRPLSGRGARRLWERCDGQILHVANWQRSMAPPSRKTSAIRFFTGMPRHSLPGRGIMKSQRVESQQTQQQWSVPLPRWCSVLAHRGGGEAPALRQDPMRQITSTRVMVEKTALIKPSFPRTRGIHLSLCNASRKPGGGQAPAPTTRPEEAEYKHSRHGRRIALINPSFPHSRESIFSV